MDIKQKKCKECKTEFPAYNSLQKYCSPKCARKAQTKKAKKERRKNSNFTLKNKVEKTMKKACRMRDKNCCQMCGKKVLGAKGHVSHVKSVGAYPNMAYEILNVKLLCSHCHFWIWHKEITDSTMWFIEKFPKRWEYIEQAKNTIHITTEYLEAKLKEYSDTIDKA